VLIKQAIPAETAELKSALGLREFFPQAFFMNRPHSRVRTTGINLLFGKIFVCVGWGFDGSGEGRHFYETLKMAKKS